MDWQKNSLRMGAVVILLAVLLRLWGNGTVQALGAVLKDPAVGSFLMYLETGRIVRPVPVEQMEEPEIPATEAPALPAFSAEESDRVYVRGTGPETVDIPALLETVLDMDLTGDAPAVLILHTHTTESYTMEDETYEQTAAYRTLDPEYNMLSIGERLGQLLEEAGISVVCAQAVHDYPQYNGAYDRSRETIQAMLEQYPSIQLVLDLHRDAATYADGSQYATSVTVNGEKIAQLMLVMGTDASGMAHPHWQENLSVALKVLAQLEMQAPGITRTTTLRTSRYNQDLHSAMLLVEVGSAGNTLQQALAAVEILADALIALKDGAN